MQEIKVKPGYKMTELGVIPEDWEVSKLGDVADFFKGKGLPKSDITIGGKYKCIHYGELFTKYKEYITEIKSYTNNKDNVFLSKENDVLMPTSDVTPNGLATASCINQNNVILGGDVLVIRNNSNNLNGVYFSYNITQNKPRVMKLVSGTTVYHLYGSDMKNYQFLLPTNINEQKSIAQVLSDTDELIKSLDELIEKKEKIKEGTMQELLTGKRRLHGFNGEWGEKTLGNIGNTYGGLTGKSGQDFENGKFPFITFLNVMNNIEIKLNQVGYVNIKQGELQNQAKKGDLFFNTSSETPEEVGMCAVLNEDVENLYLNSFCFGFRLKNENEIYGKYVSYYINSKFGRKLFYSLSQGATRYNLSKNNFNKIKINFPNYNEQKAISDVLSDMDNEIENLKTKRDKYIKIKEGMMQELLTGKIRLV